MKSPDEYRVLRLLVRQQLERDRAFQTGIEREKDGPHAPRTDFLLQLVLADLLVLDLALRPRQRLRRLGGRRRLRTFKLSGIGRHHPSETRRGTRNPRSGLYAVASRGKKTGSEESGEIARAVRQFCGGGERHDQSRRVIWPD